MLAAALASALILGAEAFPALASNDPTVPGDECSGNPNAVGQPVKEQNDGGEPNAVDHSPSSPVSGPASATNPGKSTGAKGQANSNATTTGNCTG